MKTNVITALLLTTLVSMRAISARGADGAHSQPTVALNQALSFVPVSRPQLHYTLEDYTTDKGSLRDIARDFCAIGASLGAFCGSVFGFLTQYKVVLPAILVGIGLTKAIQSTFRAVFRSK